MPEIFSSMVAEKEVAVSSFKGLELKEKKKASGIGKSQATSLNGKDINVFWNANSWMVHPKMYFPGSREGLGITPKTTVITLSNLNETTSDEVQKLNRRL